MRHYSWIDRAISSLDKFARGRIQTPKQQSIAFMRINHSALLCTKALYQAQAVMAKDDSLATRFVECAQAKEDHLKWCEVRIQELNGQTSVLNPLGYASSFGMGLLVGLMGDKISLGFLSYNQDQIISRLENHIRLLPKEDAQSRSILEHMQENELAQAKQSELSTHSPITQLIQCTSWVINKTTYYI